MTLREFLHRSLWLAPLGLSLVFVLGVLGWVRANETEEQEQQRQTMISDALSAEAQLRDRINEEQGHVRQLAAGLAVLTAGLLYAKASLHRFTQEVLSEGEVHDGLRPPVLDRARDHVGVAVTQLGIGEGAAAGRAELQAGGRWRHGDQDLGHGDIAVACALRFARDAHPDVVALAGFPALAAHSARCEALPVFQEISQPFVPPSG